MENDSIFSSEETAIREAKELLDSADFKSCSGACHFEKLLNQYIKLYRQTKLLVKMGDRMQKELAAARKIAEFQASHDGLTLILNRRAVLEKLQKEITRSNGAGHRLSIIMSDIDHFKQINDLHGHQAGDAVLREVARRIEESLRPYDYVGRYGGEEFIIILPGCTKEGAVNIAERLRRRLSDHPVETPFGKNRVTMSFGIASFDESFTKNLDTIIRVADNALYRAKQKGRNLVAV